MNTKTKITEIRESYIKKARVKNALGGSTFEEKSFVRYKEVAYVDGWPRFGHFMLDRIFFYIFLLVLGVAGGLFTALIGEAGFWTSESSSIIINLLTYLVFYPGYYLVFEFGLQSTPGKLVLGRIVVNEYGEKPTFMQILGRSYARVVPFEVFSCLSELGWHDKWSETFVIRKKDLLELQLAIKAQEFGNNEEG